ncbi:hypothetical protein SNEBB_010985 [Seison nebaliae]|nr:hypothetical protein SNEBB_010985 [Seison nebaliae]
MHASHTVGEFTNSNQKCLIDNWMEDRTVNEKFDKEKLRKTKILKEGNFAIVGDSNEFHKNSEYSSNYHQHPTTSSTANMGKREKMMRDKLLEMMKQKQIYEEAQTEEMKKKDNDWCSETRCCYYNRRYGDAYPDIKAHSQKANWDNKPITFWSEHRHEIPSVTQQLEKIDEFRKNVQFTTPIEQQYTEKTMPHHNEEKQKISLYPY